SIVLSNCCTEGSSCRMLSLRHSIGNTSPVESLARNSTSVPHFRCYASPPPTETCAPNYTDLMNLFTHAHRKHTIKIESMNLTQPVVLWSQLGKRHNGIIMCLVI